MKKLLHTKAEFVKKSIEAEDGVIEAIVGSSNVLDRMGDVIDQAGWNLKNYLKNPVILWGHNVREERPPIGMALKVWLEGDKKSAGGKQRLMFKVKFDLQDSFAAEIYRKIKDGFLNTVSVGFIPLEMDGNTFTKAELLELSVVPVPANPEAIISLRGMNINAIEEKDLVTESTTDVEAIIKKLKKASIEDKTYKVKFDENGNIISKVEVKAEEEEKEEVVEEVEKEEEAKTEEKPEIEDKESKDKIETEEKGGKGSGRKKKPKKPMMPKDLDASTEEKEDLANAVAEKLDDALDQTLAGRDLVGKGVVPFTAYETLPETTEWDGPGEIAKADPADLKELSAWYDTENPDTKASYKFIHHRASDKKTVWRAVASAMANLLGAKGGPKIPDSDKKGVYAHLAKHYEQFNKAVPEYRMVEEQVLANFDEEIQAIALDREEKHIARLIKKAIKAIKDNNKKKKEVVVPQKGIPTPAEIAMALEVVKQVLSITSKDLQKGGEN